MPKTMTLPKLGVNMTEATVVEWKAKVGDTVSIGDPLFDAETDKAVQEFTSTMSGVLAKILVPAGQTAKCQEPVAVFTEAGEKLADDYQAPAAEHSEDRSEAGPPAEKQAAAIKTGRAKISPLAKKIARDLGLDIAQISPSQPGARIAKADVMAFHERAKAGASTEGMIATRAPVLEAEYTISGVVPFRGIRKTIAEKMALSSRTSAAASVSLRADAGMLVQWREKINTGGARVGYSELFTVIVGRALAAFPEMNSTLADDEIRRIGDVNVGVAVDTQRGLLVPVIRNADQMGVLAVSDDYRAKLERALSGRSTLEDLSGGTFTITNLGMFEIETFVPIINPPQCGILGIGAITRDAVAVDESDRVEVRPRLQLTLSFDHRIIDGGPAARFLQHVKHLVEWPLGMVD